MKTVFPLIALALLVGLSIPAYGAALSNAKSQGACQAAGGIWDQEMDHCVAAQSQRACELRSGTWDPASSTCMGPQ